MFATIKNNIQTMSNKEYTDDELISAYEFAERKGVQSQAVYYKMKIGDIVPILIGKFKYIKWGDYKHVEFAHAEHFKNR